MESKFPQVGELAIVIPAPIVISDLEEDTNCTTASRVLIPCWIGILIIGLSSGSIFFLIELSKIKWVMFSR